MCLNIISYKIVLKIYILNWNKSESMHEELFIWKHTVIVLIGLNGQRILLNKVLTERYYLLFLLAY